MIDIVDDKSVQNAVEKVQQSLNGKNLNCLINNAGMATKLRLSNINEKDMMETYRQNVIGPWKVTKVYPSMKSYTYSYNFFLLGFSTISRKISITIKTT